MQDKIKDSALYSYNCCLANFINEKQMHDFEKHENIILTFGNPYYIYYFAKDIPGANVEKLENKLLSLNGYNVYNYFIEFAKNVKGANKEKIFKKLLELEEYFWVNNFLESVEFDKSKIEHLLLFI